MEVKKLLIPNKPHLDPIAAIYLLHQYGKDKFPGVINAPIIFWEYSRNPSNEEILRLKEEGVLIVDVGGSLFDHHDEANGKTETTTSLVARYLDIEKNPEIMTLLNYIREDDLEGLHNRYGDLAYLIKCMHKQNLPSDRVVDVGLKLLNILQKSQLEWHYNVKNEYEGKCKIFKLKRYNKKIKIGIVESDNTQLANYGITMDNLSVVLQQRSTGHVMILTNKHHHIDLREIIGAVRKRELELSGLNGQFDAFKLRYEGKSSQLPQWFYHRSLNAFLNGSDALSKAEPTKIPFQEIINLAWYGLSSEVSEYCDCARGGDQCPFAPYGFSKCYEQRNGMIKS